MEKKQPDLSVIIPLYNAMETLDRCLFNILEDKDTSLEVILVDDSSTDDTLLLCREYAKKDNRIRLATRPNGGVAAARNTGLAMATGAYVTFVDQDDWIEPETYMVSVGAAKKQDADMVVFNYTKDTGKSVEYMRNRGQIPSFIQDRNALVKYAFFREEYRGYAAYVWNKIFRRSYLMRNRITFEDGLRRGDDIVFYSKVAAFNPKTCYIDADYYHYVQREDSITHTMTADNVERLGEILTGYESAIEVLEQNGVSQEALDYMRCFYVFHASVLYELARGHGLVEYCRIYQKEMSRYLAQYKAQNAAYADRIKSVERLIEEEV